MKLSAHIRNSFWILNIKPISILVGFFFLIFFAANLLLTLIDKL